MNAWLEWGYYVRWVRQAAQDCNRRRSVTAPEHCSAFVATGSYTKDGKVVIGHNNWTSYLDGERWTIIFDIAPADGHRILMDGFPGLIHSGDDFGINSAGIMITETTISEFPRLGRRTAFRSSCAPARPCSTPPRSTTSRAS